MFMCVIMASGGVGTVYAEDVGVTSGTPSFRTVGVAEWSEEWSDWQFASNVIVMPWRYTALGVRIWYTDTLNTAEFTGLFLHQERFGRSFQYDGKGNVLSVENLAALKSGATYDAFNNLLNYKQPERDAQYAMTYGSTDAQITPHFVFNTLESISWKVMEKIPGDREISAMIHALAQFLRMNLRVNTPLTSVHDELEHAKLYIFIQQMRFKNAFQVTWDMECGRSAGSSYTPCDKADCHKRPLGFPARVRLPLTVSFRQPLVPDCYPSHDLLHPDIRGRIDQPSVCMNSSSAL